MHACTHSMHTVFVSLSLCVSECTLVCVCVRLSHFANRMTRRDRAGTIPLFARLRWYIRVKTIVFCVLCHRGCCVVMFFHIVVWLDRITEVKATKPYRRNAGMNAIAKPQNARTHRISDLETESIRCVWQETNERICWCLSACLYTCVR